MESWKVELYYGSNELYHHGIKGQKWGTRRWQNEDGTFNEAGKKRYFENGGTGSKPSRSERKAIRKEYRKAQRVRNRELEAINAKYDKKQTENTWGLDSGGVKDRLKNHIKNEYERQKAINKWDQKNLDARREYRVSMGKKKTDTLMMKWQQDAISDIAKQSQSEFTRDYVKYCAKQAINTVRAVRANANQN